MTRLAKRILAVLAVFVVTSPILPNAMAIKEAGEPDSGRPWLQWVVTLAMAGACAAIVFKNAKRSHQA